MMRDRVLSPSRAAFARRSMWTTSPGLRGGAASSARLGTRHTDQAGGHVKAGVERSGGTERSGAPHGVLGLDGEPLGGRVRRAEAWADARRRGRMTRPGQRMLEGDEGGIKRPRCLPGEGLTSGRPSRSLQFHARALGTDAERAP
jgi:hypothetical protein